MSHRALGPQFFHGSTHWFEPGDVVSAAYSSGDASEAHATNDARWASTFGDNLYEVEPMGHHEKVNEDGDTQHWVSSEGWRVKRAVY